MPTTDAHHLKKEPEIDWHRIESFIGYGRHDAPVIFIGMEEGLGSDQSLEDDLLRRSAYESIKELEGGSRKGQRTWRAMCDLMLRREGQNDLNARTRYEYQSAKLGKADGDTLLTELLPYPHNKATDWLYASYGRYVDRKQYLNEMLPRRITMLRNLILQSPREVVVCYGKAHWPHYEKLFGSDRAEFKDIQWRDQKPFRIADANGTRIVLAPHFSGRDFNTDGQLAELGRAALRA